MNIIIKVKKETCINKNIIFIIFYINIMDKIIVGGIMGEIKNIDDIVDMLDGDQ
jgi:p-aminobenzoyl-glutamate transporter AbgT